MHGMNNLSHTTSNQTAHKPGQIRLMMLAQMGIVPLMLRTTVAESVVAEPQAAAPAMAKVLTPLPEFAVRPAAAAPVPGPLTAPAVSESVVAPFAFSWVALDQSLAVLVLLPAGHARMPGSHRDMLARMVAAVSPHYEQSALAETSFCWPLSDDPGLPVNESAVCQMVSGFIARRLREQSAASLLILADEPPFFMGTRDTLQFKVSAQGDMPIHAQFGFEMLLTHSLGAMQADPALKRAAWQAMQPLLKRVRGETVRG
jgi:hypothetical protein